MSLLMNIALLPVIFFTILWGGDFQDPALWQDAKKSAVIVKHLQEASLLERKNMKVFLEEQGREARFTSCVEWIKLAGGVAAVFKPTDEESFPYACGESAAYKASVYLGFPYIPPTVIRTIDGKKGSLQLYVETTGDLSTTSLEASLKKISLLQKQALRLFYFVFGQSDAGEYNILFKKYKGAEYVIPIDNANIVIPQYVRYGDFPFFKRCRLKKREEKRTAFPFESAQRACIPVSKSLKEQLGDMLPEGVYNRLEKTPPRTDWTYVVYGEALWLKAHIPSCLKPWVKDPSPELLKSFKKLTKEVVGDFFVEGKGSCFLTESFIEALLKRRDEMISFHEKKG